METFLRLCEKRKIIEIWRVEKNSAGIGKTAFENLLKRS